MTKYKIFVTGIVPCLIFVLWWIQLFDTLP